MSAPALHIARPIDLAEDADPVARKWLLNLLERGERASGKPDEATARRLADVDAQHVARGTLASV